MTTTRCRPQPRPSSRPNRNRVSTNSSHGVSRVVQADPLAVAVADVSRAITVKVASTPAEWRDAFRLVRQNYLESGYEPPSTKLLRFTPYHALPDTAIFVAKLGERVVATFTLVPDCHPFGLPLEGLYEDEVEGLRRQGRRLAEVTSLAATGLSQREFVHVFTALIRLMKQYHLRQGGDTWVITVNPKHSTSIARPWIPALGPRRAYEAVQGHPAEAYWLDKHLMQSPAPQNVRTDLRPASGPGRVASKANANRGDPIPRCSIECREVLDVEQTLAIIERNGNPRRW